MKSEIMTILSGSELRELVEESVLSVLEKLNINSPDTIPGSNEFLTKTEIAKRLNISLPTVGKYMKTGKLPFRRIGRRVLFDPAEVNAALINEMLPE